MTKLALEFPGTEKITEDFQGILDQPMTLKTDTPADIINTVLPFVFVIAGLILFVMILFGGFTIFVSAGNPEKIKKGQGVIVNALIGFAIMFVAYWIIQIVEFSLGIKLLW